MRVFRRGRKQEFSVVHMSSEENTVNDAIEYVMLREPPGHAIIPLDAFILVTLVKIDIHAHTKCIKSGDPPQRAIDPDRFGDIVKSTNVEIVAITNHNHFDLNQYQEMRAVCDGACQVWPGVELDVIEDGNRGHLLVIVNPEHANSFAASIDSLCGTESPDSFVASLDDVVSKVNSHDPVYIAHYYAKKPALTDSAIDKLIRLVGMRSRVIKEATDALSAGIYVGHGHLSIYGSDVTDWSEYSKHASSLPDLRLPVDSFEQFCLLLDKDEPTINTMLNRKQHESITLKPFAADDAITLTVYNDINVFFGSKGTGKTEFLHAIARHYTETGLRTRVYEASNDRVEDRFDIKGNNFSITLSEHAIDDCRAEFEHLRKVQEANVTSLQSYRSYYSSKVTNARAKTIKGPNYERADEGKPFRRFKETHEVAAKVQEFRSLLTNDKTVARIVDSETIGRAQAVTDEIATAIEREALDSMLTSKVASLFNGFIDFLSQTISKKTGRPRKPTSTGFLNYARNRISVDRAISKIVTNTAIPIVIKPEFVGDLGEKGSLFCNTEVVFQTGNVSDGSFKPLTSMTKRPQKELAKTLFGLSAHVYANDLHERLADFFEHVVDYESVSLENLLLFRRRFEINGQSYSPSSGESSMLLLHRELSEEKEVYLLDEPEQSLGNDYISEVIVPLLKDKGRAGKKVFIATHDANIAVRTLPYNSIFRHHETESYSTYVGNPFSNQLVNIMDSSDCLDWKAISMKTLEGGAEAFGERGRIYGNS